MRFLGPRPLRCARWGQCVRGKAKPFATNQSSTRELSHLAARVVEDRPRRPAGHAASAGRYAGAFRALSDRAELLQPTVGIACPCGHRNRWLGWIEGGFTMLRAVQNGGLHLE